MILLLLFLRATLRLILLFKYQSRISTSPAVPSVDRSKAHAVPQDVIPSADGKPVAYKGARTGKIIRSLHGGELSNLVMVRCMYWRHTVVSLCVCLSVCLSVCGFLKVRGKLSADTCDNIGTTQQCLKANSLGIIIQLWFCLLVIAWLLTLNAVVACSRLPRWSTCLQNSSFVPRPIFFNVMGGKTDQGLGMRLAKLQSYSLLQWNYAVSKLLWILA